MTSTETSAARPAKPPAPGRPIGLTAWLVLLVFLNASAAVVLPFWAALRLRVSSSSDLLTAAFLIAPVVLAAINIACVIALFRWKKWGFWGLCITGGFYAPIAHDVGGGKQGFFGAMALEFVCLAILYLILTLGDANQRAWSRLK